MKNFAFGIVALVVLGFAVVGVNSIFDLGLFQETEEPQVAERTPVAPAAETPVATVPASGQVPVAATVQPQRTPSRSLMVSEGNTSRYNEVVACLTAGGLVEGADFRRKPNTETGIQTSSRLRNASQEIRDLLAKCQKPV